MTSPYPLPTLPLVPPSISVRFLTSSEIDSLNKAYDSQNYAFCISAGVYFISQTPQLADPAKFSVWELVGDSQYAIGKYADAVRSYKMIESSRWVEYKAVLAQILDQQQATTGGYNAEDLADVVRSLDYHTVKDVGEVHWVTIVGLRRAVLQIYGDAVVEDGEVGFWAQEVLGCRPKASEDDWFAGAANVDLNSITVEGMDTEAYAKLRGALAGKGDEVAKELHGIAEKAMNMTPSSNVPYNCMAIWLRSQLPDTQVYPYFACLGRDFQYSNPVCPELPKMAELTEEQVGWAELALNVVDKGLEIRPSTLGFLMKGQLLELLNKSGEKFLRKALATTGYGNVVVHDTIVSDTMEALIYSLLNNSPRYALQTAKQYATKIVDRGGPGAAHAQFLMGLCWVRGGNPGKGMENLNKALSSFGTFRGDEWCNHAAGRTAGIAIQALLGGGEYQAAREVLNLCENKGWGGEGCERFIRTKMGVVLACLDLKDEALVAFHTAIGLGAGEEAEEGLEKLERLMRGYGEEDERGSDEEGYD